MKKWLVVILVMMITLVISACSDEEDSKKDEEQDLEETIEGNNNGDEKEEEEVEEENENDTSEEESEDVSGGFETQTEDQLDLTIGDTGKFDTDLTTFEITLENAKIQQEVEGKKSELYGYIILDITVKNTGATTQPVQDLLYGFEVTDNLEMTGYQNYSENYESIDHMTGELDKGEEVSGQFITKIYEAEEYYFRLRSGITGSGASNEVIWTIPAEEAK